MSALAAVHRELLIDEPWTIRGDHWFGWLSHRLAQTVIAGRVVESCGVMISHVTVRTSVVEDVRASLGTVEAFLGRVNAHAVGSGYVYLAQDRRIEAVLGHATGSLLDFERRPPRAAAAGPSAALR